MNVDEYLAKINIDYLNEHINEMLSYNVPFPIDLVFHIRNKEIQESVHMAYLLKAKEYQTWYDAMKRFDEGDTPYYDYCYKKLLEYVVKMPQFKELLR